MSLVASCYIGLWQNPFRRYHQRPQLFSPLCALEADLQSLTNRIFVELSLRIFAFLLRRVLHASAPFGLLEGQQA